MTYLQAAILGVLQGLTEFLPVSSSGHLALAEGLFGLESSNLMFEVTVHLATLIAVVAYYRHDILSIAQGAISKSSETRFGIMPRQWLGLLILGSLPAALIGLGFKSEFESSFSDYQAISIRLLATGMILFSTAALITRARRITLRQALLIGIAQAAAILPGISRSGTTIAAALWLGIEREQAARFSFLLSIPAVGGAFLLQLASSISDGEILASDQWGPYLLGFIIALVVGYLAVTVLIKVLVKNGFAFFGIWCLAVGLPALWISSP